MVEATSSDLANSSRVVLKNIPPYVSEAKLRERFRAHGSLTDVKILTTKAGTSRQLAFLGFKTPEEARRCVKANHRTFFDAYKLQVEIAKPVGDTNLQRPWSKHSKGSSKFEKQLAKSKVGGGEGADTVPNKTVEGIAGATSVAKKSAKRSKADEKSFVAGQGGSDEAAAPSTLSPAKAFGEAAEKNEDEALLADDDNDDDFLSRFKTNADDLESDGEDAAGQKRKADERDHNAESATTSPVSTNQDGSSSAADRDKLSTAKDVETATPATGAPCSSSSAASTGRLFVTNLPYSTTEEELKDFFERFGRSSGQNTTTGPRDIDIMEVGEVKIPKDEDTKKSRGFGFVTYVFPEHAVRALAELDKQCFQGRLISVQDAKEQTSKDGGVETEAGGATSMLTGLSSANSHSKAGAAEKSSYKRQKQQELKQQQSEKIWNLLYMSANSATDAMAKRLGVEKRDLLSKEHDKLAVTVALGETQIIAETKRWLEKENIWVDAFTRSGKTLLSATENPFEEKAAAIGGASSSAGASSSSSTTGGPQQPVQHRRAKDVFLVKHLPAESVSEAELRERFARFGEIRRFCLAPSKTVCVVQFASSVEAERCFNKVNFSRYKHVPLFLEWAPEQIFRNAGELPSKDQATKNQKVQESAGVSGDATSAKQGANGDQQGEEQTTDQQHPSCSIFVKYLNFNTTEMKLEQIFRQHEGFKKVTLMKKKGLSSTSDSAAKQVSMGYGFIEYQTMQQCEAVVKKRQNMPLDGHVLQLQVSDRKKAGQFKDKQKSLAGVEISSTSSRRKNNAEQDADSAANGDENKPLSNKLCVRNIAFETTKSELQQLFAPYGTVTSLRLPKKADRSGQHRGFAFVDFLTKSDCLNAFENLQHTHLYGRKLVLEPAEKEALTLEEIQAAQVLNLTKQSEKEKRKRENVVDAGRSTATASEQKSAGSFAAQVLEDGGHKGKNSSTGKPPKKKRKIAKS
ncbi:unnamed protein product [Amoebophrya sp. A120]|nr:unnamed protein product [Amoebophrya sp. A120]|eukprot:GSA120T00022084001.1